MKKIQPLYCVLLLFIIIFSSCHSKKAVLRGKPGEVVKPQASIAERYSAILGVEKNDIQNGRLYAFIDIWMGTPYKFGGADKDGVDCSAFVQLLEQQVFAISIPRSTSQQINVIKRKYEEELVEGDLVFFDYDGKRFSHVGVYLQNGYYAHASVSKGVTITKLHDPFAYKYFSRGGSVVMPSDTVASVDRK